MTEKLNECDEIDLIDIFVVLIRHRLLILVITISIIFLTVGGYFFIPKKQFIRQNYLQYTKAQINISMQPFIAQYMNENNEILISINQNDLVVNNYLHRLLKSADFLVKSIIDSGNSSLLLVENTSSNTKSIAEDHMTYSNSRKPQNLSINDLEWIYKVERKSNYIEITCYFKSLDKKQVDDFLKTLLDNANDSILGIVKPHALDHISTYRNIFDNKSLENNSDDIFYDYAIALGIISDRFLPIVVVSDPVIEKVQDSLTFSEIKKAYIKLGCLIIFVLFFLSIFIAFTLEYWQNIKKDKERYDRIKNALRKN